MEQSTHPFSEAGFTDISKAAELFEALQVNPTLMFPEDIQKLQHIAKFAEAFDDGASLLQKVARKQANPQIKTLDHVYGYVKLQQERIAKKTELEALENEINHYE